MLFLENNFIFSIPENLFKLKVSGCKGANDLGWKKQIANFLYWTSDTRKLQNVPDILKFNESVNKNLCKHIKDIVNIKISE